MTALASTYTAVTSDSEAASALFKDQRPDVDIAGVHHHVASHGHRLSEPSYCQPMVQEAEGEPSCL